VRIGFPWFLSVLLIIAFGMALSWVVALTLVFAPLAIRQYRRLP
jgi:hypothetical protein